MSPGKIGDLFEERTLTGIHNENFLLVLVLYMNLVHLNWLEISFVIWNPCDSHSRSVAEKELLVFF